MQAYLLLGIQYPCIKKPTNLTSGNTFLRGWTQDWNAGLDGGSLDELKKVVDLQPGAQGLGVPVLDWCG